MKRCLLLAALLMVVFVLLHAAISAGTPQANSPEEDALRQIQTQFASAWAKSDAHSMAALFASDADLIIPTGVVMRGQTEIEAFYSSVFAQGYSGSQAGSEILRIRFLRADLALVDATWFIENIPAKDGSAAKDETGTLTLIATKSPLGWRIAALRESASAHSFRAFADLAKHR
jgi:uncharacterized protein (TIGR02246 family)